MQKKGQKYQNRTAFKIMFNPKQEQINSSAPLDRLCQRCFDQIKWKIQYGKYKPRANVSRCNKCSEKNVNKAYRTICDKCADKEQLCTKCEKSKELVPDPGDEPKLDKNGIDKKKLREMEEYMDTLRERSRRKILRLINKGTIEWNGEYFVDIETGEGIDGIKFKGDIEEMEDNWDDDEEGDNDFDEDDDSEPIDVKDDSEEEEKSKKGAVKEKSKKEAEKPKVEEEKSSLEPENQVLEAEIVKIVTEKTEQETNKAPTKNEKSKKKQDKGKKKKKKQDSSDDSLSGFSDL